MKVYIDIKQIKTMEKLKLAIRAFKEGRISTAKLLLSTAKDITVWDIVNLTNK